MNKLMGFYELKDSGLPSVKWEVFNPQSVMDKNYLWTVRTAIDRGDDLNLPRIVGKNSEIAYEGALNLYNKYKDYGIVIYYPYFIAEKSGTLQVSSEKIIIEAVQRDLWNLVTDNKRDITIIQNNNNINIDGDKNFISQKEINEFNFYVNKIRNVFKEYIIEGKTLLLEWSYAYDTDINSKPIGNKYLVFYEIREV